MYVCICHAITENHIIAAVEEGAADIDDLSLELGLGSCCGTCTELAETVLEQHAQATEVPRSYRADRLGVHHYSPNQDI